MKGTKIQASSPQTGVVEPCIVVGTPKPGTLMELVPATEPVGNVYSYAPYGTQAASGGKFVSNDGDRKHIAILLERDQDASTFDDAYVTGERGRVYTPRAGEWFNVLLKNESGTGDSFAIGDELMIEDGSGKLIAVDSDAEAHPFTIYETLAALTADAHALCRFNGEGGA